MTGRRRESCPQDESQYHLTTSDFSGVSMRRGIEYAKLHKTMLTIMHDDQVCRHLMSVPGVGPVVAITFKTAVDEPTRISKPKAIGPLFGLTPKKYRRARPT
jgi:transposase